jgi:hypothetical protein
LALRLIWVRVVEVIGFTCAAFPVARVAIAIAIAIALTMIQ